MTKPKTLKDLKIGLCDDILMTEEEYNQIYDDNAWASQTHLVGFGVLREEAKKWIKELDNEFEEHKIEWIKHFFNLEE